MEGRKQNGTTSSSFTSELFGSKDEFSPTGIFGSMFAPSAKVLGKESVRYQVTAKKQCSGNESSMAKFGVLPDGDSQNMLQSKMNLNYQEQRVEPCHFSSSIYYGGQDIYAHPQSTQSSGFSTYKKAEGEDDSESASRGNWWQGSLYY